MVEQEYGAERGEAKEDKPEDGIDETKEDRTDPVGDETIDDDERGEPGHQAGGGHQDSPLGGGDAQDRMGEGEPLAVTPTQ
jgi:hypothetical protein